MSGHRGFALYNEIANILAWPDLPGDLLHAIVEVGVAARLGGRDRHQYGGLKPAGVQGLGKIACAPIDGAPLVAKLCLAAGGLFLQVAYEVVGVAEGEVLTAGVLVDMEALIGQRALV